MHEPAIGLNHRFGEVSYAMLLDALRNYEILHRPRICTRRFKWFETIYDEDNIEPNGYNSDTLILCRVEHAVTFFEKSPNLFCIALVPDDTIPKWVKERNLGNHLILLRQQERFARYDTLLRALFMSNLIWENEMDRVVYSRGKLDRIITVSESMLDNFISITDTGHNLIAYSRGIEPPADALIYQNLVQNGCYDADEITYIEKNILPVSQAHSQLVVAGSDDRHPYTAFHYPVYIEGSYLFHVTMVCALGSVDLLHDLFLKFMKRVVMICNDFWKTTVNLEAPWHRVFVGLINGESMTEEYVETQLAKTAAFDARRFRLIYIPFDANMPNSKRAQIVAAAQELNDGNCYPFMLKGNLCVLAYATSDNESSLSGQSLWKDLDEKIYKPFGTAAGASQMFYKIRDIEKAYRQAFSAYALRGPLKREYDALTNGADVPCYPFEHALKFYLLTEGHDIDLVEFAFNDSILSKIIKEDEKSGTSIAQMIWVYICHGRNATETAKLMHVHRNTVLYHLARIEERFDISFDSPMLRSRLVLDYQRILLEDRIKDQ